MPVEVEKRLINVEEYYKMAEVGILKTDDRVELINGEIYEMSPIGSKHAAIVNRLARQLNMLFEKEATIGVQSPVRLDNKNEPEPDISILKFRSDDYSGSHPNVSDILLVIEVADSSVKYDKNVKMPFYASFGIPEYWIVDIDANAIEVFKRPGSKAYDEKQIFKPFDIIDILGKTLVVKEILILD
ncbi:MULTISPECIES: Uma2 family endonuclease [unclassified Imperialibacter]|uniref:Uma2 family endonuclease n=1 Tax=unclassified Imperialibacter TaxID=2629706 RepID=UPI00125775A9|nr:MULTISPECIES: Uma2 family endonuclease [unclassified Imperialibacter]CAD5254280.1 Endonuclease, Uma2 family (Restriction endonuclease fold) [Imperialibacter sp. 89]CAD5267216.1 Endonuclease, Uma2 family (Restriction endonuclease fold) [Imperialibacter sp. 75]VVT00761.1 Endonuclease, Uma2 family (Restriction endonuclease fold) [Imperialibacter sp. EC-SDR9]